VYVGNLSFDTSFERVCSFIQEMGIFGTVDLKLRDNGSSMGWALVQCASADEAASAVPLLNGVELDGRALRANIDRGRGGDGGGTGFQSARSGGFGQDYSGTPSTNSLYVGNLSWAVDDAGLQQLFADYGAISANVQVGFDGRSRGYGIVRFTTTEEASAAIDDFNGFEHEGRQLSARFDVPRQARPARAPRAGGGSGGFSKRGVPNSSIFVRNLPENYTWTDLKKLFGALSPEFADVKTGPDGFSRGWGIVRFSDASAAAAAIEQFNGYTIPGSLVGLEVRLDAK
jgi:RNA recognition motif-containing protein